VLLSAGASVRSLADSGELKQIHERFNAAKGRVETEYLALREHLAKTLQIIEAKENELYAFLGQEKGLSNLRIHGEAAPILDTLGLTSGDAAIENLSVVEAAAEKGDESLAAIADQLHAYIGVKAKIYEVDAKLKEEHVNYVVKECGEAAFSREEWRELYAASKTYQENFGRRPVSESAQAEYDTYIGSLNGLKSTQGEALIKTFKDFERTYNDRKAIYSDFKDNSEETGIDSFRTELLQHLAGSIVVKENRNRYQKEQFDRFVSSLQYRALTSKSLSLREFCREYASMIEVLVEDSHNDRSPKIEANYDDFGEKTVRPINATIFYYFFSADRRKRTIAQWLLSAVRYPNERVRRAYMHFFA